MTKEKHDININEYKDGCRQLIDSVDIFHRLKEHFREAGYVGEPVIPCLVFFCLITGKMSKPVSLLITGQSGAGKSYALDAALRLVPTRYFEYFSGMSEKALVYMNNLSLKNKHLIIGEASGMTDGAGRTLLRQLLSEGQLRYATVQNTSKDGLHGYEMPLIEGPCGLIMTTTATSIHTEDASRMICASVSDNQDGILHALMAQALGTNNNSDSIDFSQWHALYEYIRYMDKDVIIPYAVDIAMNLPLTHDKIKRDFPQVLSLIRACTLLHIGKREEDSSGRLIATLKDYEIVYSLVNSFISEGIDRSVADSTRSVVEAVQALTQSGRSTVSGVSITEIADSLDRDPSVISRTIKKAIEGGYLINETPGQGREASIRIGKRAVRADSALPLPELLLELNDRRNAPDVSKSMQKRNSLSAAFRVT